MTTGHCKNRFLGPVFAMPGWLQHLS